MDEDVATTRLYLLALACDAGIRAALVDALGDEDVAACETLPDDILRPYLRALERGAEMDRGEVPADYGKAAHCDGCGPIWWHRAERLVACPWCRRSRSAGVVPRPSMQPMPGKLAS